MWHPTAHVAQSRCGPRVPDADCQRGDGILATVQRESLAAALRCELTVLRSDDKHRIDWMKIGGESLSIRVLVQTKPGAPVPSSSKREAWGHKTSHA